MAVVAADEEEALLEAMRSHPLGVSSAVVGEVGKERDGKVLLETIAGGTRIMDMLSGEQLPRIC